MPVTKRSSIFVFIYGQIVHLVTQDLEQFMMSMVNSGQGKSAPVANLSVGCTKASYRLYKTGHPKQSRKVKEQ
jgi:hypothetical protein